MMANYMQHAYDDHPSIAASLEDFETPGTGSELRFRFSSPPGSELRSPTTLADSEPDSDSVGPWSPPAWRRPASGWFQYDGAKLGALPSPSHTRSSHSKSREPSPLHDGGPEDVTLPVNVPLPGSPVKGRSPSPSPEPVTPGGLSVQPHAAQVPAVSHDVGAPDQDSHNYIRLNFRAEYQHRTEPLDAAMSYIQQQYNRITKSRASFMSFFSVAVLCILMIRNIFHRQDSGPGPDLIKVAGLAKSFEPLIHYSENGVQQIGDLQETGVAVWDLGESVRSSNMTSAPIIVKELDDLSDSLKGLAVELTKFFANVDGDVDSILIVMDWAKRELSQISAQTPGSLQAAYDNVYTFLHRVGGSKLGTVMTELFGKTHNQINKATLQRTFHEFLNVLEESINSELIYSTILFGLFEAIDRQFLNLQRTTMRETDSQERENEELLASLWTRVLGANKTKLQKYEKNLKLLADVKGRTVRNKYMLVDHNGKLLKLKSNLEILRKRLVSPLVRSNDSSTLSIHEQIQGLDGTYEHLRSARERQKSKLMERLYGAGNRRMGTTIGEESVVEGY